MILNKSTIIFLFAIFANSIHLYSQQLKVLDYGSKKPIPGVHVYNLDESKSAITDSLGLTSIDQFEDHELLVFSHTTYNQILIQKSDLYTSRYKIELHPTVMSLEEFVISANKRAQVKEEVPNRITSISAKDVRIEDPQTSADLLQNSGKVFVQKSQLGGGSPTIRGFAANKVLIVVDGVRMNNAIFRGGNLQNVISIDPNSLEKTEVVYGPGSVIYGSDALGGVMDFQTLSTKYNDSVNTFHGNAFARYSSANQEITPHLDFTFASKKFSSVTSLTYSQYDDLKMGSNGPDAYLRNEYVTNINNQDSIVRNSDPETQVPTGFSSMNWMQKFGYKFSERLSINYSLLYSATTNYPRYDRLILYDEDGELVNARWDYGPQKWMMNNLSVRYNNPNKIFDNLNVTVAHQLFEESRIDRKYKSAKERTRTEKVNMFSVNLDFDNAISGRTTLYYGLESVHNLVNSTGVTRTNGNETPTSTRYPDGSTYFSNAGYFNLNVNKSERTTFVVGMRFNHVHINAAFDTNFYNVPGVQTIDQSTGALTGSAGVAYRPNASWQINTNFSSGFKAPNIDDIAKVFDSEPGFVVVPNPDLRPEYLYSFDLLLAKKFGPKMRHRVEVSGFYSFLVDAMVRRPYQVNGQDSIIYDGTLSQVQTLTNVGSANLAGATLLFEAGITSELRFNVSATYTYGKDDEGFYLRHASPVFGASHLIYTHKKLRLDVYTLFNGSITNKRMAPTELNKPHIYLQDENGELYSPSWYTLNVKGAFELTKSLMITAGVENLTNQRYRPYSSGIVAPGLNFIGSVKATF